MLDQQTELKQEQRYFDGAWDARERVRESLKNATEAAGGRSNSTSAMQRYADQRIERLGSVDDPVAFGRIDLDDATFYIGNHAILNGDEEPLVINWRAPAAEGFYKATMKNSRGLTRKRVFKTQKNQISSFSDDVFADLAERFAELTGPERWDVNDAVLAELDSVRSTEMNDIVRTIHAAQFELIQAPLDCLLLVQGGPGTGKSAVALHRISFLLFNHRDQLAPADCLVVGPNPTFVKYIRGVLPGLGDDNVVYASLGTLGPQKSGGRDESSEVCRLKGDVRMARLLRDGLFQHVGLGPRAAQVVDVGRVRFSREELNAQARQICQRVRTYADGRASLRTYLTEEARLRRRGEQPEASAIDAALERVWPSVTPQAFLQTFLATRERLLSAADGSDFRVSEINLLMRDATDRLAQERWSDADIALLDELDNLINGPRRRFKHIVIDEAQDLSPMQLRSIRRRSANGSMTVVGDIAQSTGVWARDDWNDIEHALSTSSVEVRREELELGYRVPRQVFEFAAQVLPYAAPNVRTPRVVRDGPAEPSLVEVETTALAATAVDAARAHAGSGRFVGVICASDIREHIATEFTKQDVNWNDAVDGGLNGSINVVDPLAAKGLEFDAVVVVDPESIAELDSGLRLLYIALTRTTKYLTVVHDGRATPLPRVDGDQPTQSIYTVDEDPHQASEPFVVPALPNRGRTGAAPRASGMFARMIQGAASWAADEVIKQLPDSAWPDFLEALRRELDVERDAIRRTWEEAEREHD